MKTKGLDRGENERVRKREKMKGLEKGEREKGWKIVNEKRMEKGMNKSLKKLIEKIFWEESSFGKGDGEMLWKGLGLQTLMKLNEERLTNLGYLKALVKSVTWWWNCNLWWTQTAIVIMLSL